MIITNEHLEFYRERGYVVLKGVLTDDDLDQVEGDHQKLVGKLQERYGYAKDCDQLIETAARWPQKCRNQYCRAEGSNNRDPAQERDR